MAVFAAGLAFGSAAEAGLIEPGTVFPTGHSATGGIDPTFVFTFSGTNTVGTVSGTATLNATDNGDGSFTAISGGLIVTGSGAGADAGSWVLVPNPVAPAFNGSASGNFSYDDQLFPGQDPVIDGAGLLFTSDGNDTPTAFEINISSTGLSPPQEYALADSNNFSNTALYAYGTATLNELSAVPEPSSFMLFGVAALAIGGRFWRRRRKPATRL